MAILIDGSTPAVAVQATGTTATVVSGSFTPPVGSVLLVRYSANTLDPNDPGNPTITDNLGAHLTYTSWDIGKRPDSPLAEGQVATWTTPILVSAAMTITVTNGAASPNRHAALQVTVITGAEQSNPVGTHGKSSSLSAASIAQAVLGTRAGSRSFITTCDWADIGAQTAGTATTLESSADVAANFVYGFFRAASNSGVPGANATLNVTIPGTSTSLRWAWVEILPLQDAGNPFSMHPLLLEQLVAWKLAQLRTAELAASLQIQAEAGSAAVAVSTTGQALKVAVQSGSARVAVRCSGAASKVATEVGSAAVAVRAAGLGAKVAPEVGNARVAVRASAVEVNSRAQTGSCSVAVRGTGAGSRVATERGTAAVAVRTAGLAAKVAPQTGSAAVAVTTTGFENTGTARAQTGSCSVAARGSSSANKVAVARGTAAVAVRTTGAASKSAAVRGTASVLVAVSGSETSSTARAQSGSATVAVRTAGSAGKTVARGGTASVAVRGSALAAKRQAEGGSAAVAVTLAGLASKRAIGSGSARVIVSAAGLRIPIVTHVSLGDRLEEILDALISFTKRLGIFEAVQGHEPKSSPKNGLTAALWLQTMAPAPGASGLDSTTLRIAWYLRIYQNFLSKPEDSIDPKVMRAMAAVMEALTGNFDLDIVGVRAIDVLGAYGPPMASEAGYVPMSGGAIYRCMTLTIPVILNDAFVQAA